MSICNDPGSDIDTVTDIQPSERHDAPPDESLEARLDRLGRARPPAFASTKKEVVFVFSIVMSQFLTEFFVSGFTLILPTLIRELGVPQASAVWPSTAYSLAIASTLLIFGRLGDMWGGYPVYLWGLVWLTIWSIIAGFSVTPAMLNICRALQGLGSAAALPTGIMLMGSIYRPGPRKNLVFAIYGMAGIFGFFGGIVIAGVVGEFLRWGFYFWIGTILAFIALITSTFSIPRDQRKTDGSSTVKMDYYGAVTIVSGLVLTVFAIVQSAHAPEGWRTVYVPVCFVLGILLLISAVYIEARIATDPLLPASILTIPSMIPLLIAMMLLYGCWGIFSVFGTLYFQNILGASPLQIAAWYTPLGVAGLLFSVLEAVILHLVPGRVLLIIAGLSALGSQLLIALIPRDGWTYWAWVFPATILSTIGIDLPTILMTVFITTKLPLAQQGLAGGILNSALQLGIAFILGWTELVQSVTVGEVGLAASYKNTFWFGVGSAALGLVVLAVWGNVPRAQSELTADERAELLREEEEED